jgi:glycosyltransferase involved in cell wall biosynthesis
MISAAKGAFVNENTMKFSQDSVLLITGDGPERRALEALAHSLGAASKIRFLGRIDDVACVLRMCDVGVAPSAGRLNRSA